MMFDNNDGDMLAIIGLNADDVESDCPQDFDLYNELGNMSSDIPSACNGAVNGEVWNIHRKRWELNYQEAAIFLQEGANNDKFLNHPRNLDALPAYQVAHNKWFYIVDLIASLLVLFLAACERPAVSFLTLPVGVHGALELFCLLLIGLELGIRLKWLGFRVSIRHKRSVIKVLTWTIMFIEAVVVLVRQTNHFRVTRALRPLFLIDTHYCKGIRRICRQILQSLPPIIDMILLLLFFMLIFSILGFYLFSSNQEDQYFSSLKNSFVSLFVLLTTANYPDVMLPSYDNSKWSAIFFVIYLSVELYFLMNLLLAVVYDTFSNLEKMKLKKLFLHRRLGCRHAFGLLVTKANPRHIQLKNFSGLMKYFNPKRNRKEVYLIFKTLNVSKTGTLSLEEFYSIYDINKLKWCTARNHMKIWSTDFKRPLNIIFKKLYWFVTNRWFEGFIYVVIATNFVWILAETVQFSAQSINLRHYNFQRTWVSIVFISLYIFESIIKILGKGPMEYFTTGWDIFDFLVTILSVIGMLGEFFDDAFFFITVLRPFRLLRLFKIKRRYRDVLGTFFVLFNRLLSMAGIILLVYYFFAIIGMEIFLHTDLKNCCKNTSVEDFYKYVNGSQENGFYYLSNFNSILDSGVTLFELTVVNNWFIIMEGYAHHVGDWTRAYFMIFYLVMMVVMNIVLAFILELFLFRIQYRRQLQVDDIDDHSKQEVVMELSEEEEIMCSDHRLVFSGHHIHVQDEYPNVPKCSTYKGVRTRKREDFSLRMYSDEVKTWIAEDKANKSEVVNDMTGLRLRSRPNANVEEELSRELSSEFQLGGRVDNYSSVA